MNKFIKVTTDLTTMNISVPHIVAVVTGPAGTSIYTDEGVEDGVYTVNESLSDVMDMINEN